MARFFVENVIDHTQFLTLTGENAEHARVLRLKNGELVTVCDGEGTEYRCTVSDVSGGQISLVVNDAAPSAAEARVRSVIYMAFPKADKLEHVIQKATELGVDEIVAFPSARCVARPDEKALKKKLERWHKIARSAAEQSRRGRIPTVLALSSYEQALARAAQAELSVLFYENERSCTFRRAIESRPFSSCALMTGPEGGFENEEVEKASAAGLQICTLGRRILRCETAPLCALSALQYAAGEF